MLCAYRVSAEDGFVEDGLIRAEEAALSYGCPVDAE